MDRPIPPRTVKPRKRVNQWRPIIAIDRDGILMESTGQVYPRESLGRIIITQPSSLVVAHNIGLIIKELDDEFSTLTNWNFRATPIEREIWKPNRERALVCTDTVISYFGFRERFHFPLDPLVFNRQSVHDLIPDESPVLGKLMQWAQQVRQWMLEQGIALKPTQGGIATALLRDPRFYPDARRKVPKATNARMRDYLPGNYYRLKVPVQREYQAVYLDQVNAHHSVARAIQFPNANELYAKGRFDERSQKLFAKVGTPFFDRQLTRHGLFKLVVHNRQFGANEFPLPCQEKMGLQVVHVYSNELDYLQATGTKILGIVAAWTADTLDTGLSKYAEWALAELDRRHEFRPWLKPALLSTYGTLATRPKRMETGFRHAKSGVTKFYPIGGSLIEVTARIGRKEGEAQIANVIHRGMIEAETRLRSIRMAQVMQDAGFKVLAIYADSVFAETNGQTLPLIPPEWRVQQALTRLTFFNDVSFTSNEMTKLPGIPREARDRLSRVRQAAALAENVSERGLTLRKRRIHLVSRSYCEFRCPLLNNELRGNG